jgi:gas vesicle protein
MKFISGLIFGSLAGVAAAMLYAPQSGDETRRMIRNTAMDASVRTRDTLHQVQDQVQNKVGEVQQRVGSKVEEVQHRVGEVADEVRSKASRMKGVTEDVLQRHEENMETGRSQGEDIIHE